MRHKEACAAAVGCAAGVAIGVGLARLQQRRSRSSGSRSSLAQRSVEFSPVAVTPVEVEVEEHEEDEETEELSERGPELADLSALQDLSFRTLVRQGSIYSPGFERSRLRPPARRHSGSHHTQSSSEEAAGKTMSAARPGATGLDEGVPNSTVWTFPHQHPASSRDHELRTLRKRRDSALFTQIEQQVSEEKLVLVMVGLPARGKSYISKALVRYLNFLGCGTKLFNAGNLRRVQGGAGIDADFFNSKNAEAKAQREAMAMQCLEDLIDYLLEKGSCVGILDATNTTIERRKKVRERIALTGGMSVIFIESLCKDQSVLEENYRLKLINDDYKDMTAEKATKDFEERVHQYEEAYEPLQDVEVGDEISYIKLIDAGKKLIKYRCQTTARRTLPGHVLNLLHSIHLGDRSIFLARVGQSRNELLGRLGGDSPLTEAGSAVGPALAKFVDEHEAKEIRDMEGNESGEGAQPTLIMCGTLQRHLHTVAHMKVSHSHGRMRTVLKLQRLNELCVGGLDGMSLDEVKGFHPEEAMEMEMNKHTYRYPGEGGESYQDLVLRLHDTVLRLEQLRGSGLILCDPAVFRVFLAYFRGTPLEEVPSIEVPEGIVHFTRTHSGFHEAHISLDSYKT